MDAGSDCDHDHLLSEWERPADSRDHVELPEDFLEKAKEKLELHLNNPVAADKRGE